MGVRRTWDTKFDLLPLSRISAWERHVAQGVSQLGSPPLLATVGIILAACTEATPGVWRWAATYLLLAILMPLCYVIWLVRRGQVTDLDVQLREQRSKPLLVAVAGALIAWLILYLGTAPNRLVVVASATWIQMALIAGVTLRWKISVHCATAAGVGVLAWYVAGSLAAPLLIGVLLIAWSRVRLGRHTPAQTLAGTLLGLLIFSTMLSTFG